MIIGNRAISHCEIVPAIDLPIIQPTFESISESANESIFNHGLVGIEGLKILIKLNLGFGISERLKPI